MLIQREVGEKRANWVTTVQEYDVEIHPAKIIKGQGFCRMLTGASHLPTEDDQSTKVKLFEVSLNDSESQYQLIDNVLFRKNYDVVLLKCLEKLEAEKVMQELHDGPVGGHLRGNTKTHKILHVRYYWPTLFKDAHEYAMKCKVCKTAVGRERKAALPLQPVNIHQAFEQWGLDIIGEITPTSSKQHKYILTATNYFTKWVESIPLKVVNTQSITDLIDQFIITRFGLPSALMFDNAS